MNIYKSYFSIYFLFYFIIAFISFEIRVHCFKLDIYKLLDKKNNKFKDTFDRSKREESSSLQDNYIEEEEKEKIEELLEKDNDTNTMNKKILEKISEMEVKIINNNSRFVDKIIGNNLEENKEINKDKLLKMYKEGRGNEEEEWNGVEVVDDGGNKTTINKTSEKEDPKLLSGLFQGDIQLSNESLQQIEHILEEENSTTVRKKRSVQINDDIVWKKEVYYYVEKEEYISYVEKATSLISQNTCFTFKRRNRIFYWGQGLLFLLRPECYSAIGAQSNLISQVIGLNLECFQSVGHIQHEIGHAFNLIHEHSRKDRDEYIYIYKENIRPRQLFNFIIDTRFRASDYGISYDFGSVMHYSSLAFSKNGQPTMIPKYIPYKDIMGQNYGFSFNDYKLINKIHCSNHCEQKIPDCENGGYQDPNNCNQCKCPHGYYGTRCRSVQFSDESICGEMNLTAKNKEEYLTVKGKMNCTYHIQSDKDHLVYIYIKTYVSRTAPNPKKFLFCYEKLGLEIKYKIDKGSTGICFCGYKRNIKVLSEGTSVLVMWYGEYDTHMFSLKYKQIPKKDANNLKKHKFKLR